MNELLLLQKLFMVKDVLATIGKSTRKKGILLLVGTIICLLSLLTYSSSDGCVNVVSSSVSKNLLGKFGAIFSDLLYQCFGFSIFFCFPFLFYLSVRYFIKQPPKFITFKLFYTIIATMCLCFLLGCLKKYQYIFAIPLAGKIGIIFSDFFPVFLIKCVVIFTSIIIVLFTPYATFVFGAKTRKQSVKESRRHFSFSMLFYNIHHVFIQVTTFIAILVAICLSPVKSVKFIINRRKLNKSKKRKINTHTENYKENTYETIKYTAPVPSLLKIFDQQNTATNQISCKENMHKLSRILGDFGVRGDMIGYRPGPIVTLYEFKPQAGVKASRIISLADDIARTMMVSSVRTATISGRDTLGIEVPNKHRQIVCFRRLIESADYQQSEAKIPMVLGCNIFGKPIIADLTEMPHLLIAGTTGSGKSVGINGMILSMLYKLSPEECRLIMIDPKMLEFSAYEGIPHLLLPVVTDAKNAVLSLKWVVREMENRYRMLSEAGVRNITGYNQKIKQMTADGKNSEVMAPMHYIVVVIDEMADLMVVAGKEIEVLVQRLSQMARAAGIHLIMATQRPSVDVITGVIKANFPTRISYHVTSKIDSRTILGEQGAEQLLGKGDMLFMLGGTKMLRVHGPMISDEEVENVVNYLKKYNQSADYITLTISDDNESGNYDDNFSSDGDDMLYRQALKIVLNEKKTSISYLQRKLRIGYNKAANFIEKMEEEGYLSEPDHAGKRILLKESA